MTVTVRKSYFETNRYSLSIDLQPPSDEAIIYFEDRSQEVRAYINPRNGPVHNPSIEVTQCINDNPNDIDFFPLIGSNKFVTSEKDLFLKPLTRMLRIKTRINTYGGNLTFHNRLSGMYYMHSSMTTPKTEEYTLELDKRSSMILPIYSHAALFRWTAFHSDSDLGVRFVSDNWRQLEVFFHRHPAVTETIPVTIRGIPFIRGLGTLENKINIVAPTSA